MHLTRLSVQGFRSLKDVTWEPGKLNVVIGPNGSGKTNIIRLLELICESAKGNLTHYIKNEGGSHSIVWDGIQKEVNITVNLTLGRSRQIPCQYDLFLKTSSRILDNKFSGSGSFTVAS